MKASGSWRPVINLSLLNMKVRKTSFKMETLQLILLSVQEGDWMVSLDLKDAYLQVPIHPDSCKYLRFVAFGRVYQFKALCFGLPTAPQVFTRVMAPVSAMLHREGIRIRRYLDDWLFQAASRVQVLQALDSVLQLCHQSGIVLMWEKSHLEPAQRVIYLGVLLDSVSFRALPAQKRVEKFLSIGNEFLSCLDQLTSSWLELLGVLASPDSCSSWRSPQDVFASTPSPSILGSMWRFCSNSLGFRLSKGSRVVARSLSSKEGDLSVASVPQPRLLVRRLGRRLGSTFGRFRSFQPLVSSGDKSPLQWQGIAGRGERFTSFHSTVGGLHGRSFRRQFYCDRLSSQSGRHEISSSVLYCSENSLLGGVASCDFSSTVHQGKNNVFADSLSRPNQVQGSE